MATGAGGSAGANDAGVRVGLAVGWDDAGAVIARAVDARVEATAAALRVEKAEATLKVARQSLTEADKAVKAAVQDVARLKRQKGDG